MADIIQLTIEQIEVPEDRITSIYEPDKLEELKNSIKEHGILQPLQVALTDGHYILEDGLNRLLAAKEVGILEVPALVHPATERDILLRNLLYSRAKGRSNPAQEAKVVKSLQDEHSLPVTKIAELTGISEAKIRDLLEIATLQPEVLAMVESGSLRQGAAVQIAKIKDASAQVQVARDTVGWHYTEQQTRDRVQQLLMPQVDPAPGGTAFTPAGEPHKLAIQCEFCARDLVEGEGVKWICGECLRLSRQLLSAYNAPGIPEVEKSPPHPPPKHLVLGPHGWGPP